MARTIRQSPERFKKPNKPYVGRLPELPLQKAKLPEDFSAIVSGCHMAEYDPRRKHLLIEALSFTIEGLSTLPIEHRPDNNIAEMKTWLDELIGHDETLGMHQSIAQRRLEAMRRSLSRK